MKITVRKVPIQIHRLENARLTTVCREPFKHPSCPW
jgi:hypothetical protein